MSKDPKEFLNDKKDEPMKIVLKKDALEVHSRSTPAHAGYSQHTIDWRNSVREMIKEHGLEFEVNTQYLRDNSFMIEREGEGAISIPEMMVEKIINDKRETKQKKSSKINR